MENRKCKICGEFSDDYDHIDKHPHIDLLEYLYKKSDEFIYCKMCPNKFKDETDIKKHIYQDHNKKDRFIQITDDASGKYFTY